MKSFPVPHCLWFFTTIGMFVAGTFWTGTHSGKPLSGTRLSGAFLSQSTQTSEQDSGRDRSTSEAATADRQSESASYGVATKNLQPLSREQIEELVKLSVRSTDPVERRRAFDQLLQQMQADSFDVEQAMMMRSALHQNGASGEQWRLFDYAWGANDPIAAMAHIDEIAPEHRAGFTSNMLPGLASVEPEMAIELVSGMEGKQRQQMMGRLLEGLADYDVDFATDYVFGLEQGGEASATQYMHRLANEVLGTVGFDAGLEWADALEEGPLQAAALVRVANEYANEDPVAASQWAERYVKTEQNSRLFGEVVREWGDFDEAAQWVDSLEPSRAKLDALSAVYGYRGATAPHEAVQEIVGMEPSADRNFAINGFISGLAHKDGEAAVIWAAEITDPGMREAAMVRAGQQYFRQDTEAAIEWLAGSGLSEAAWERVTVQK